MHKTAKIELSFCLVWIFDVPVSFVTYLYSYDDTETCEVMKEVIAADRQY